VSREAAVRLVGSLFFPDLMPDVWSRARMPCADMTVDKKDRVWICTRSDKHSGRHAHGDGQIILAVWPRTEKK
jgi:hypothetical protein